MNELSLTLVGDGSSDCALVFVIKWLLNDRFPDLPNRVAFADLRRLPHPPTRKNVAGQVRAARQYYPCQLLIYHRDAEENSVEAVEKRQREVLHQLEASVRPKVVCIVPVRMTETWLLIDEVAIKKAAGNRNYRSTLPLPSLRQLESLPNPKEFLHDLLLEASQTRGRRRKQFNLGHAVQLVADNIADFAPLRQLSAFRLFEGQLVEKITHLCAP